MSTLRRAVSIAGCILPLAVSSVARAQSASSQDPLPSSRPWTVEVHGGILSGARPGGGSGQLPPYNGTFQTANGEASPAVSSWYLGDGAAWINKYLSPVSSTSHFTPIDGALTATALQRQRGPSWGFRVTRQLSHHLDLDVSVDRGQGALVLFSSAVTALQTGANTFESAWRSVLSGLPSSSTSSQIAVHDNVGRETLATAAFDVVFGEHRFVKYIGGGGGVAVNGGTATATLTGTAGFAINGQSALQTDSVAIAFAERHVQPTATIGGGVLYYLGGRTGFRVDVRAYLRRNPSRTFLTTSPTTTGTPTVEDLLNPGTGVIQFSGVSNVPSTLSQAVNHVQTFAGAGVFSQLAFTIGYFVRF